MLEETEVAVIAKAGPMEKMQISLESFVTALICQAGSQLMSKIMLVPITRTHSFLTYFCPSAFCMATVNTAVTF